MAKRRAIGVSTADSIVGASLHGVPLRSGQCATTHDGVVGAPSSPHLRIGQTLDTDIIGPHGTKLIFSVCA